MTGGRTNRILTAYRIGDPDGIHPIYDSEGARLYPGRWNMSANPIIYTSEHYSTAMLEKLVHASSVLPPNQHHIRITIPYGISYEIFQTAAYPGWDEKDEGLCEAFGQAWFAERRSAILLAPSMVAWVERNILINPVHPNAKRIRHELPEPVWWDDRLYG